MNITNWLTAFPTLVRAVPGVRGVSCHIHPQLNQPVHLEIKCESDEAAEAVAKLVGIVELSRATIDGFWWLRGQRSHGEVWLNVSGPHHNIGDVTPLDERKVAAAVTQAQEAIAS